MPALANSSLADSPPASAGPVSLPCLLGKRYRLERVRGGGGMAAVYRALDVTLQRHVAVKLLHAELRQDPEFDSRFQREARIASQLADPHIVVVHDFGIDLTHGPYLVMEYLEGQSLREHIQEHGPLKPDLALDLGSQILLALIHAHAKGIVHRDLKPDNVFLLNQAGVRLHVRVLDFGIARIYQPDDPGPGSSITHTGAILGTPRYMSPEQLAGHPVDARSDLYSFGLILHEALTGTLPYATSKHLTELCPEVPYFLATLLAQCLEQEPDDRPARAIDIYLRLQEASKGNGLVEPLRPTEVAGQAPLEARPSWLQSLKALALRCLHASFGP